RRFGEVCRPGHQAEGLQRRDVLAPAVAAGLNGAVVPDEGRTGAKPARAVDVVDVAVAPVDQPEAVADADDRGAHPVDEQDTVAAADPGALAADRFWGS